MLRAIIGAYLRSSASLRRPPSHLSDRASSWSHPAVNDAPVRVGAAAVIAPIQHLKVRNPLDFSLRWQTME